MAIPNKPLELKIDAEAMPLDEYELFEPGGFSIKKFKAFMGKYSNWTAAEAGQLTRGELKSVVEKIAALFREDSVPK